MTIKLSVDIKCDRCRTSTRDSASKIQLDPAGNVKVLLPKLPTGWQYDNGELVCWRCKP